GGQLFIGVTSDQQWTRFVEEFGLQELAADPRLATNVMRLAERAWLIPALQEVLATVPQDEVARRCERCNVSWAPVCQPCRSSSVLNGNAPASGVSRRAWARTMPRCWAKPASLPPRLPISRR